MLIKTAEQIVAIVIDLKNHKINNNLFNQKLSQ